MAGYHIDDMDELKRFHAWMNTIDDAYREVNTYVQAEVVNKSGFTGVLSRLGEALDYCSDGFSTLTFFTIEKWEDTEEAFFLTARTYAEHEGEAVKYFKESDRDVQRELQEQIAENKMRRLHHEGVI